MSTRFDKITPKDPTSEELALLVKNNPTENFQELLIWLIKQHNLPSTNIQHFEECTSFVFSFANDYVIKLIPPSWQEECVREISALRIIEDNILPLEVQKILGYGEVNHWQYFITNRMYGTNLFDRWHTLAIKDRQRMAQQSAEFAKALHSIDVPESNDLSMNWNSFLQTQRKNCFEFRKKQGLKDSLLNTMEDYLDGIDYVTQEKTNRLMHTDLHAGNFLANPTKNGWELTGIIDFGDALYSPDVLFEAATALIFSGSTDASTNRLFLDSLGLSIPNDIQGFQNKLMALSILRHSGSLNDLFEYLPETNDIHDWQELSRHWFAL